MSTQEEVNQKKVELLEEKNVTTYQVLKNVLFDSYPDPNTETKYEGIGDLFITSGGLVFLRYVTSSMRNHEIYRIQPYLNKELPDTDQNKDMRKIMKNVSERREALYGISIEDRILYTIINKVTTDCYVIPKKSIQEIKLSDQIELSVVSNNDRLVRDSVFQVVIYYKLSDDEQERIGNFTFSTGQTEEIYDTILNWIDNKPINTGDDEGANLRLPSHQEILEDLLNAKPENYNLIKNKLLRVKEHKKNCQAFALGFLKTDKEKTKTSINALYTISPDFYEIVFKILKTRFSEIKTILIWKIIALILAIAFYMFLYFYNKANGGGSSFESLSDAIGFYAMMIALLVLPVIIPLLLYIKKSWKPFKEIKELIELIESTVKNPN